MQNNLRFQQREVIAQRPYVRFMIAVTTISWTELRKTSKMYFMNAVHPFKNLLFKIC